MISGNVRSECRRLQDGHVVSEVEVLVVIQYCTSCQKLVYKKCSGIKVMKSFGSRGCLYPVTSTVAQV